MSPVLIVGTLALLAFAVYAVRSRRASRPTVAVIDSPTWGTANFIGGDASTFLDDDIRLLAPILGSPVQADFDVPVCDVLFLYCRLESGGAISGCRRGLREVIRDSSATIVVVAIDNPAERYIAAGSRKPYGGANLVMTMARNGAAFGSFFAQLFSEMKGGVSMPVAWVQLAPQGPGDHGLQNPETIFACEAGQVAFRSAA